MAGGEGRRLRPITAVLPKPLVPIGEISVLEMVLRQLKWYGFDEAILCIGPKAELIMAVVGDGARFGLDVRYHIEARPMGTIGSLAVLEDLREDFLVLNGDVCTDMDFGAFFARHESHGSSATVSTYARRERIELGVLELDANRERLIGFQEKPNFDFWVAMGVNAFNRSVLDLVPDDRPFGFDDLMAAMLEAGLDVRVFPYDGFWLDIGRPDDYESILDQFPRIRADLLPDETERTG
jgi:NDP-sugar pyrophosphorylase family protein